MTKNEIKDLMAKFLESIPDDVETVENSVETELAGENENTESVESTEKVLSTETIERTESVTENGEYKSEEKRIYVTDSGEYAYR